MNRCPTHDEWREFLDETFVAADRAELREHLERCVACQSAVDRLCVPAGAALFGTEHVPLAGDSSLIEPPPHLFDKLRHIVQTTAGGERVTLPRLLQRGERLGDFVIESELGRGGMGIVFRARDATLRRVVALKLVYQAGGEAARFTREAEAAARVRHDHVVPVLSAGLTPAGDAFIAMPLIEGLTLRQLIERDRVLPPKLAAEYARQIADALRAIHGAGLVHRDVKPGNVLIDQSDGRAKLTDFGLARDDSHASGSTTLAGTPEYLSPEQVRAPGTVDARTDIYALGVTLYETVTGTTPFRGPPHHVLQRIVSDEPPRPRSINLDIPPDLQTIILTAIDPDASRRYPTAQSLRDDLTRWLTGEPIHARPAGRLERGWKWARRHPWPTAAGLFAAALVVALAAAFIDQQQAARRIAKVNAELAENVDRLNAANRGLAFAKEDAEKALRISRVGVIRTTKTITERLADVPKSEPLVLEMLKTTSDVYRQLAELRPDDAEMAALYTEALQDFTKALAKSGNIDAAGPALDDFEAELERQRTHNPADPNLSVSQLELLKSRERLQRRRQQPADLAAATAAFNAELDRLGVERPNDPRVLSLLFERYSERMVTLGRAGDMTGSLDACRQSVEIGERWRAAAPRDPTAARQLALQLGFLAMVSYDLKKFDEALDAAGKLERVCDDPVHPDGRSLAYRRGIVWLVRGLVAKESGDLNAAAQHLASAETIYRKSDSDYPREYNLRTQLATVLGKSGVVAAERSLPTDARRFLTESRTILQKLIAEYPSDSILPGQLSAVETELGRLNGSDQ
jgi:tetratricopeptide (TPR) repeat protein